jgi:hypothetical protein
MPSPLTFGAGGAAVMAAAAGAFAVTRRRFRRSMDEPPIAFEPESDVIFTDGFAEAEVARSFNHRAGGAELEPVVLLAEQAVRFLDRPGSDLTVVLAKHGRSATTLTLSAEPAARDWMVDRAPEFGRFLGGSAAASLTEDRDVQLRVTGLKMSRLLHLAEGGTRPERLWLAPLGALGNRELVELNWQALGHVLVAGEPGGGVETVVTGLLGGLAARLSPLQLRLVTIAGPRSLPERLRDLPHQLRGFVDATDAEAVGEALAWARDEVFRRTRQDAGGDGLRMSSEQSEITVVLAELADIPAGDTTLDFIANHGPAVGVRLLAATSMPEALSNAALAPFGTRLVLRLPDESQSMRLVGQPEAFLLDRGGEMLVRIEGREPIRLRGYRLASEHLDELVRLMTDAFGQPPAAPFHSEMPAVNANEPERTEQAEAESELVAEPPQAELAEISGADAAAEALTQVVLEDVAVAEAEAGEQEGDDGLAAGSGQIVQLPVPDAAAEAARQVVLEDVTLPAADEQESMDAMAQESDQIVQLVMDGPAGPLSSLVQAPTPGMAAVM